MEKNKTFPEWTDGDLQCCIQKESDTAFVYGEVRAIALPNEYIYCVGSVEISDYTNEQLEEFVSFFYQGGVKEIKDTYCDKSNQIIAECVFEIMSLYEMFYCSEVFGTENDAAEGLDGYVKQYCKSCKS